MICNDLCKLVLDILRVNVLATHGRQSFCCLLQFPLLDKVPRTFGKQEETDSKDDCPEKLDGNGDTIGATIISVLSRIAHDIGEEDSDGDAEIVACDQRSTHSLWGNLLVTIGEPVG